MSISILMASSLQWRCQCRALLYFLLLPQRWRSATQPLWSEQQEQQARRAAQAAQARPDWLVVSAVQVRAEHRVQAACPEHRVQAECPEARAASAVQAARARAVSLVQAECPEARAASAVQAARVASRLIHSTFLLLAQRRGMISMPLMAH